MSITHRVQLVVCATSPLGVSRRLAESPLPPNTFCIVIAPLLSRVSCVTVGGPPGAGPPGGGIDGNRGDATTSITKRGKFEDVYKMEREWDPEPCGCGWHVLCNPERISMMTDKRRRVVGAPLSS